MTSAPPTPFSSHLVLPPPPLRRPRPHTALFTELLAQITSRRTTERTPLHTNTLLVTAAPMAAKRALAPLLLMALLGLAAAGARREDEGKHGGGGKRKKWEAPWFCHDVRRCRVSLAPLRSRQHAISAPADDPPSLYAKPTRSWTAPSTRSWRPTARSSCASTTQVRSARARARAPPPLARRCLPARHCRRRAREPTALNLPRCQIQAHQAAGSATR